jgi:hypothetical protein
LGEQPGFEEWDAVEAPGGVGDFVDELGFGGGGGFVLIEKLLDVALVVARLSHSSERAFYVHIAEPFSSLISVKLRSPSRARQSA